MSNSFVSLPEGSGFIAITVQHFLIGGLEHFLF